ncbi:MAG: hypothetical protein QM689_12030 [Oscillospiraceae bacterium]
MNKISQSSVPEFSGFSQNPVPDDTRIYQPRCVSPLFATNIITDNVTNSDGNVINRDEVNAYYARKWVDDNKK